MVFLGVLLFWSLLAALPFIDLNWRMRAGLVTSVALLACISLWPSLSGMTGGRLPCPKYVQDNVEFRLVAGLDLRGGLRLVYTVDVDEAIKDRRDRYYEDMRTELARIYVGHKGETAPSDDLLLQLAKKVELIKPKGEADLVRVHVLEGADPGKIDARFRDLFKPDFQPKVLDSRNIEFNVREEAESQIRERAVAQAKEIILRRVDEMGLREASVSTRDEDIIVEVPGEDEESFTRIREIISQTARLEFKLNDDTNDYFASIKDKVAPESLPDGLEFRT
jgi:preprotein translocase subunit SecD